MGPTLVFSQFQVLLSHFGKLKKKTRKKEKLKRERKEKGIKKRKKEREEEGV